MDQKTRSTLHEIDRLLRSGDSQTAQNALISLLQDDPNLEQGWYLLSFALENEQEQLYALRHALEINPNFTAASTRLATLAKHPPDAPDQTTEPHSRNGKALSEAHSLINSGDQSQARQHLRAILKSDIEEAEAWFLLSFTETTLRGQINALRQALRIDSDFHKARQRLQGLQDSQAKLAPHPLKAAPVTAVAPTPSQPPIKEKKARSNLLNLVTYTLRRALVIGATIVIGVLVSVLITNKGGQIDDYVDQQVSRQLWSLRWSSEYRDMDYDQREAAMESLRAELQEEAGLNLPPLNRHLMWTYKALRFDWAKVVYLRHMTLAGAPGREVDQVKTLVMQYLPNTLMLFGAANILVFIFGLPLSLFLATRAKGSRLDRFIALLSPLSSVPSWVHGILLVTIFAVALHLLPFGGKYDNIPPNTQWGYIWVVAKHMILPVAAILLSMIFQLVFSWRTFFLIYSDEDYVELAQAKGMPPKALERRYILRPTLPFILTNFALSLVGFWQMSTALEYFFNWPGIGTLYVVALPNFWGESFFPGEVSVILSVVVLFAYMLGFVVFALDVAYAVIDPRIRLGSNNHSGTNSRSRSVSLGRKAKRKKRLKLDQPKPRLPLSTRIQIFSENLKATLHANFSWVKNALREIRRYPSAIIGLSIIGFLVLASLYTVIALPYGEIGSEWRGSEIREQVYRPKNVPAEWTNWFRKEKLPATMILRTQDHTLTKTVVAEGESGEIVFSGSFEYPFTTFPQDLYLYIDSTYDEKRPHITIQWTTPDGREISPKSPTHATGSVYIFSENIVTRRWVRQYENWQDWFVVDGQNRTPEFYVLFADPEATTPKALPGSYQIEISALTFEENSDVEVELVFFGQVYGAAGTDNLRRDLTVPLLWGLPFTLVFGVAGAITTSILAMLLAAAGVWFGGWLDSIIQRLTEANMILPVLAVGILVFAYYGISLWIIMGVIILLNIFGSPTKAFRAAFLQVKEAPYIEAARAYGAGHTRIILQYMIPKIMPVLIPQLVALIPALVFLEATLGMFNVFDPRYPTWGRVIFEAVTRSALWGGSAYWVLQPIALLLLIGVSFALVGFALERVLNPRMQTS